MKPEEFVNFLNQSIAPESGLRHITVEDLHRWHEIGFFVRHPEYCRFDFQTVFALLKNEAYFKQRLSSQLAQPAQIPETEALEGAFQRGFTQVISCVGSSLIEEQLIIQGLKDTGLIASAGLVAVNFYPFSRKPIQIPSSGVEADQGNALVFEADGAAGNIPDPVVTPIGTRRFTEDDASFNNICNSISLWGHELLPGIEHMFPPKIAEQMRSTALQKKRQFVKPVYTFPLFVPIMKASGIPATIVDSVYITPGGQRIPPLPTITSLVSPRLYQVFLNTNGNSMQEIVKFVSDYNLILRVKFPTDDPQRDFCVEQQRMREVLAEAHKGHLSFEDVRRSSASHEDALVEADFIKALLMVPDYADYISEIQRASGPHEHPLRFLPVRRYYSWIDYMWAEVLADIGQGFIPILCKGCGKVLTLSLEDKPGRRREYCMDCEPKRGKERVRRHRSKLK